METNLKKTTSNLILERLNKNFPGKEEDLGKVCAKHREGLSKEAWKCRNSTWFNMSLKALK